MYCWSHGCLFKVSGRCRGGRPGRRAGRGWSSDVRSPSDLLVVFWSLLAILLVFWWCGLLVVSCWSICGRLVVWWSPGRCRPGRCARRGWSSDGLLVFSGWCPAGLLVLSCWPSGV